MNASETRKAARRILEGYARAVKGLGAAVALVAIAVASSAVIVFPLWYLSTHHRTVYTSVVSALVAIALLYFIVLKVRRLALLPRRERVRTFRGAISRIALVIGALAGLYVVLGFYVSGLLAAAIPLTIVYLVVLGFFLYARKPRSR